MQIRFLAQNPFQRVSLPDTIVNKLEAAYSDANAKHNVFNLVNRKDFTFHDGIYSFQGQGPHFSRRIFIYNKGSLFIFESEGAFDAKGIIREFADCIEKERLNDDQVVRHTKVISVYLEQEKGNTYGRERQT